MSSEFEAAGQADFEEYAALLKRFDTAMLTTQGPDGHFHSRPMALQEKRPGEAIWFATLSGSDKCRDIEHAPKVALSFHGGSHDADYLSISGHAAIVNDRAKIREMWDASWRPWFPEGPEQKDIVLIQVIPEHVEWVKPEGGKLRVLASMLKRTVTGSREPPDSKKSLDVN